MKRETPIPSKPPTFTRATFFHLLICYVLSEKNNNERQSTGLLALTGDSAHNPVNERHGDFSPTTA